MHFSDNDRKRLTAAVNTRHAPIRTPSIYGMEEIMVLPPIAAEIAYRQQDGSIIYLPNLNL